MRGSGTMVEEESETTQFYAISMALLANYPAGRCG
jgi:hypothetical protein